MLFKDRVHIRTCILVKLDFLLLINGKENNEYQVEKLTTYS